MSRPPTDATNWLNTASVQRLLCDLIRGEYQRMRPDHQEAPASLEPATLGLDSIEFLDLSSLVSACFHLHQTGLDHRLLSERTLDGWSRIILDSRAAWDEAFSFQTSGSTGRPKVRTHPRVFLEQEIDWFADHFADRRRVLTAVPAHHIYGFLFTILLPAALGIPVSDLRSQLPAAALRLAQPGDLIIGYPAFFELAMREQPSLAADVKLLTSTGPLEAELWPLLGATGCAEILEIYGSTETSGVGVRSNVDSPYTLLPFWSRTRSEDPTEASGITRQETNGQPLICDPPDHLQWLDQRHFKILARRDGAIQIAGVNVFPSRIAGILCKHPDVSEAQVRLGGSGQSARLKAFVVPSTDCPQPETLTQRLHDWAARHLPPLERPRSIQLGSTLPRSPLGKLADWNESGTAH